MFSRSTTAMLVIAAAAFLVYAGTLGHGFFAWDDDLLVTENPIVQQVNAQAIAKAFTTYDPELYIPFTILTFQIEHLIVGNHPFLYHFDNVLLHVANSLLFFLILKRLLKKEYLALFGALLFAVHPLNAEAVSWIAARKDLLCGFFFLLTILQYLRYSAEQTMKKFVITLLLFLAALLSKATVIGLPLVLLLIDWFEGRRFDRCTWQEKLPFFGLSILFGIIALGGKTQNMHDLNFFETILLSVKSAVFSLRLFFFPINIASTYQQHGAIGFGDPTILFSLIFATIIAALALWLLRWSKAPLFALLFFFLLIAPTFSNFSRGGVIFYADDRYLYLPQIGLIIGLLTMIGSLRWESFRKPLAGMAAIILLACGWYAFQRSQLWGNSEAFFRHGIAADPESPLMHFNLGVVLHREHKIPEAMNEYATAIKMGPRYVKAYGNLGVALLQIGRTADAILMLKKALELDPTFEKAKTALGIAEGQ